MYSKNFNIKLIYDMRAFYIYLLLFITLLFGKSYGSYPINIKDGSLKIPPYLARSSAVVYQDVIYVYGGSRFNGLDETAALYSYTLNNATGEMVVSLVNINEGPICSSCSTVLYPDTGEIWVFAEPVYDSTSKLYSKNASQETDPIVVPHIYHIKNNSWSVLPVNIINGNRSTFYERVYQTTVLGKDGTVYVLGGINRLRDMFPSNTGTNDSSQDGVTSLVIDGWYYNKSENSFNTMSLPTQDQYVYSGGFIDR
jgi:hypothetical protein